VLTLFQAEWCPFSAAVRQRLTELGLDFVARQVEPRPEQRREVEEIPVLQTPEGDRYTGTREIFGYLSGFHENEFTVQHRKRYNEHRMARLQETTGTILERATPAGHAV
jgi:glutathione S-transferase